MRIWVIMGGWASERAVSLESGQAVAKALGERGHAVLAYELADGCFLRELSTAAVPATMPGSVAAQVTAPGSAAGQVTTPGSTAAPASIGWAERLLATARLIKDDVDVAFLALHGGVGENGTIQALLEAAGFPYTGSGPTASGVAMDKCLTKLLMEPLGIATPAWTLVPCPGPDEPPVDLAALAKTPIGGLPVVVKPISEGSSVGIAIVMEAREWEPALRAAARPKDPVSAGEKGQHPSAAAGRPAQLLVEQYIPGRELTVGILDGEVLPTVEILPHQGFYDYGNKYSAGRTSYQVPADLPAEVDDALKEDALRLYLRLGCRGMARVDFRYSGSGRPQCLELNTIPGLTGTSLLPKAAQAVGIGFAEMLERICLAALRGASSARGVASGRPAA